MSVLLMFAKMNFFFFFYQLSYQGSLGYCKPNREKKKKATLLLSKSWSFKISTMDEIKATEF